ncbi:MAG TPA: transcriptional regulator [Bacteroidota bacterium]|nr:transcriptional regulator [Bacteroidota bacterium]
MTLSILHLGNLNRAFESRVRLAIMSILSVREEVDFNELKGLLGVTDGNLATHVAVLERRKYIRIRKEFVGRKTRTTYMVTDQGRRAFAGHLDALEELLRSRRK